MRVRDRVRGSAQENAIKLSGTDLNRVGLVIKIAFYFLMWAARCIVVTQNPYISNVPKIVTLAYKSI